MSDANNRDRVYADNKERKAQYSKTNPERARALFASMYASFVKGSLPRTVGH